MQAVIERCRRCRHHIGIASNRLSNVENTAAGLSARITLTLTESVEEAKLHQQQQGRHQLCCKIVCIQTGHCQQFENAKGLDILKQQK